MAFFVQYLVLARRPLLGGGGQPMNPLLHTWSLGVEEQFYFLMQWLLAVFSMAGLQGRSRRVMGVVLVGLGLGSLWPNGPVASFPVFSFYLPTRLWELFCRHRLGHVGPPRRTAPERGAWRGADAHCRAGANYRIVLLL
ncbi:MAG: hypothetical protein R2857_15915 [Vampirovibrionales bacterium]